MLFVWLLLLATHPESFSRSDVHYGSEGLRLDLRVQVQSLAEVVPELAQGIGGELPEGALETGTPAMLAYLAAHYRVVAESEAGELHRFAAEAWEQARVAPVEGPLDLPGGELVDVHVTWPALAERPVRLKLEVDLFLETSPQHRDLCQFFWFDDEPAANLFHAAAPTWIWPPPRPNPWATLGSFASLGASRWLASLVPALFTLTLVLGAGSWKGTILRLALFLTGLAVALPLGEWGPLAQPTGARLILLAWLLSVPYLAVDTMLHGREARWIEPGLFGLIHGLALRAAIAGPLGGLYHQVLPSVGTWIGHGLPFLGLGALAYGVLNHLGLDPRGRAFRLVCGLVLVVGFASFLGEALPSLRP